ncbi:unnamed protein product [Euphydryas editha]|uniref:Mutant cadherin n=1 Tax=Euphydryas editha TaxID=104508 RepID=A0AAU9VAG9_EUPED|nr:unnamed protein product [Euphydryas editha]
MLRVKCNNCNIIINEVLSFIQNKLDVMNNVSLALICKQSFSEEDIAEAKSLLYESVQQKKVKRRGDDGKIKNIEDIIGLLKGADPDIFTIFVAKDLQKLPPVSFDHIDATRLLKDILVIQKELSLIKEKCSTFEETFVKKEVLKQELENCIKGYNESEKISLKQNHPYVSKKRGGFCLQDSVDCDSGPMGLMTFLDKSVSLPATEQNQVQDVPSPSHARTADVKHHTSVPVTRVQRTDTSLHVEAPGQTTAVPNVNLKLVCEAPAQSASTMTSCIAAIDE